MLREMLKSDFHVGRTTVLLRPLWVECRHFACVIRGTIRSNLSYVFEQISCG
jgi:hypothetical protein